MIFDEDNDESLDIDEDWNVYSDAVCSDCGDLINDFGFCNDCGYDWEENESNS